ncbi:MAG TPA: SDR family oxidoreductase [Candidatus Polarisedimenticolia bacterium]|nr:SDR family oxidoreductase [Candidatus Polarisedimenticolia bacterium]
MTGRPESRRILVTGAGRGLGLEFSRQWLERGHEVFALARDPGRSKGLADLKRRHPDTLRTQACDVADDASVERGRRAVEAAWDRLDILVNNAGLFGTRGGTVESLDLEEVRRLIEVNTLGPLRVTRAFLPLLRKGTRPRVIQITSLMGSIDDNKSGSYYSYRLSKAALNMASRNLAHDLKTSGILSVALHPGWVRTEMGGSDAPLGVEEAVSALIHAIDALTPDQSGGFFDRLGKPQPW